MPIQHVNDLEALRRFLVGPAQKARQRPFCEDGAYQALGFRMPDVQSVRKGLVPKQRLNEVILQAFGDE